MNKKDKLKRTLSALSLSGLLTLTGLITAPVVNGGSG